MNTISRSQNHQPTKWLLLLAFLLTPAALFAAEPTQSLSVSPALFEMSATPGQEWRSSIKVVNPNPYDLTVYVEAVNFAPRGEGGDGTLLPVSETEEDGVTLAEWVSISDAPIVIKAEQVQDVPFTVTVPKDAPPGGHFAAFMVGTRPPADSPAATQLRTAQIVTSLFFVRVAGDVKEHGSIREFRADKMFVNSPAASFSLRFENTGNVHIRPQGDITIINMWGQERGVIPINRQNHFGNVLPESVRKFTFSWRGEWSLSDIGRYTAVVTLAYGQDARQFVTSKAYFWVIPVIPVLIVLVVLFAFISIVVWLVRLYVRRLLVLAGVNSSARQPYTRTRQVQKSSSDLLLDTAAPRAVSVVPEARGPEEKWSQRVLAWLRSLPLQNSVRPYAKKIVLGLIALCLGLMVVIFIRGALTPQRSYEVSYDDAVADSTVGSDTIMFEAERENAPIASTTAENPASVRVNVVNASGVAGAGATIALLLETQGYTIGEVTTELGSAQGKTVIVYQKEVAEIALQLSKDLDGALLSAYDETSTPEAPIVVYIGSDITSEGTE